MIDLNHKPSFGDNINAQIDSYLIAEDSKQPQRTYLGGSRVGVECERSLQYEFYHTPKDVGKDFPGRILRIFKRGFWIEDVMADWMQASGYEIKTVAKNGEQFGFAIYNGMVSGHCDGILIGGHSIVQYPCLWENKGLGQTGWRKLQRVGLKKAYPEYYAQVQYYQKYFKLCSNPAIFSAVNMNDMHIYWEAIGHDSAFVDRLDTKVERILLACKHGEQLPRQFHSSSFFKCKWCNWHNKCWGE